MTQTIFCKVSSLALQPCALMQRLERNYGLKIPMKKLHTHECGWWMRGSWRTIAVRPFAMKSSWTENLTITYLTHTLWDSCIIRKVTLVTLKCCE